MSFLVITNEHDMEVNINYVTELASNMSDSKIEISFPSSMFAEMFMENLMKNFAQEGVPRDCGLSITLNVPRPEGE